MFGWFLLIVVVDLMGSVEQKMLLPSSVKVGRGKTNSLVLLPSEREF